MQEKKIATSVDLLINVGQYEHLQITKYAETKIEYESKEEMVKKEDQLTDELVADVIRTMRGLPEKLGKKTEAVSAIEEKIIKKIPGWLENNPIPNMAEKKFEDAQGKESARVEAKKETMKEASIDVENLLGEDSIKSNKEETNTEEDLFGEEDELFDDK